MEEPDIDPVEELHEIRRKLYKKAGGTPEAYVRYLMEQQNQYADRLVDFSRPGAVKNKTRRKSAKQGQRRKAVTV